MKIPIANAIFDSKIEIENYLNKKNNLKNLEFLTPDKKISLNKSYTQIEQVHFNPYNY